MRPMSDTNRRVQSVIDRFVSELTSIAREEAARVVLGGSARAGRAPTASNGATAGSHGATRSPERIEAMQTKLIAFVKSHPGLRIEQINAELGTTTKDVALPIRKLVAAKQLKTSGARRATKYFAGGKGSAKGAGSAKKHGSKKRRGGKK